MNGGADATPTKTAERKAKRAAKASEKSVKEASNGVSIPTVSKTENGASKKQKLTKEKAETNVKDKDDQAADEDSEDEIDDQTEALLKGFESDHDEEDDKIEGGYKEGDPIPPITDNKELSMKKQMKLKKVAEFPGQVKPGVVFVSRIPHGFYENEMKAYFGQFGNILQLRLSRNRQTGASKHFAFIQFQDASVADIVAKTMDNYLMFGHILKVKLVPNEQVPANVWKGSNKRFKKVPWNKMKGRELEQGRSEGVWEERNRIEQERRDTKATKLKAIGYEFDAPALQSPKGLSKKAKVVPQLTEKEGETEAIEAAPVTEDSGKPKKKKKKSKAANEGESAAAAGEPSEAAEAGISVDTKPSNKDVEESVAALIAEPAEKPSKKEKKSKKNKDVVISQLKDEDGEVKPAKVEPAAESSSKPKKDKKKKNSKVEAE